MTDARTIPYGNVWPFPGSISHRQREGWGRALGVGVVLGLGLYVYATLVGYPLTDWLVERGVPKARTASDVLRYGWPAYVGMMVLAVAAGGFWEELVFRHIWMERVAATLRTSSWRWPAALLSSSVADALLHVPFWGWSTAVFAFQMFLIIGTLYVVLGRDIRPLMVGHALFDTTVLTTAFFRVT